MKTEEIEQFIKTGLPGADAYVEGDGTHFTALVIFADFSGKTRIQRQQMVYETVRSQLADGTLHALSVKTMTPEESQAIDSASNGDHNLWKN